MIGEFRKLSRCPKPILEVVWVYRSPVFVEKEFQRKNAA
jgi:hypothetical protein